ncbi:MAG: hypothetical protein ABIL46_09100 [candidate division WOR-3 bacterium]
MKKKIETFEFIKEPKELSELWYRAITGCLDDVKTKQDFVKNYFTKFLGRRLKKEETIGKQCIRVYFDNKGDLLEAKIYNTKGEGVLNINFDIPFGVEKSKPKEKLKPPFIEETGIVKILNVEDVINNCIKPEGDLVINDNEITLVFRKISLSPFDIYITDPMSFLFWDILNEEFLLYKKGYKLIEMAKLDIDGVIDWGKRHKFNEDGLLIRQEFYTGTPWGGTIVDEITEWNYEIKKHQVVMKHSDVRKGIVMRMSRYEIDDNGAIIRHIEYLHSPLKAKSLLNENYFLSREHHYKYNENGQISEVITRNHSDFGGQTREKFSYDSENRLILEEFFDSNNKLESKTSYEYISATKVRVKSQFYPNSFVYQATQNP